MIDWAFTSNIHVSKYTLPEKNITEFLKKQPEALAKLNEKLRTIDIGIKKA